MTAGRFANVCTYKVAQEASTCGTDEICQEGSCIEPTEKCSDGIQNQDETDID